MEIEPIKSTNKTYYMGNILPPHPSRLLIVGCSQLSGKSTLMINLLRKMSKFWKDNVIVISPTAGILDKRWPKKYTYYKDYDPEILEELMEEQKGLDYANPVLVIMDDLIGNISPKQARGVLTNFIISGRHYNISCWITSQRFKTFALPPIIRQNMTNVIIFKCNPKEVKEIYEEHSNGLDYKTWMALYEHATLKPHQFLQINYNEPLKDGRFTRSFEKILSW